MRKSPNVKVFDGLYAEIAAALAERISVTKRIALRNALTTAISDAEKAGRAAEALRVAANGMAEREVAKQPKDPTPIVRLHRENTIVDRRCVASSSPETTQFALTEPDDQSQQIENRLAAHILRAQVLSRESKPTDTEDA